VAGDGHRRHRDADLPGEGGVLGEVLKKLEAGASAPAITMILIQEAIHHTYFLLSAAIAVLLVTRLFHRKSRPGLAYDIVYAYAIIPFVLRALHIK
jgi:hypothetical protein